MVAEVELVQFNRPQGDVEEGLVRFFFNTGLGDLILFRQKKVPADGNPYPVLDSDRQRILTEQTEFVIAVLVEIQQRKRLIKIEDVMAGADATAKTSAGMGAKCEIDIALHIPCNGRGRSRKNAVTGQHVGDVDRICVRRRHRIHSERYVLRKRYIQRSVIVVKIKIDTDRTVQPNPCLRTISSGKKRIYHATNSDVGNSPRNIGFQPERAKAARSAAQTRRIEHAHVAVGKIQAIGLSRPRSRPASDK